MMAPFLYSSLFTLLLFVATIISSTDAFAFQSHRLTTTSFASQQRHVGSIATANRRTTTTTTTSLSSSRSYSTTMQLLVLPFSHQHQDMMMSSSSLWMAGASPVDPTTAVNDALLDLTGTPVILAVPILVGLGAVGIVVWILTASAVPAEEEDD